MVDRALIADPSMVPLSARAGLCVLSPTSGRSPRKLVIFWSVTGSGRPSDWRRASSAGATG